MKTSQTNESISDTFHALHNSLRPAPNKAQHSPLPWKVRNATHGWIIKARNDELIVMTRGEDLVDDLNAQLIVRAVNHAEKLAEALRMLNGCAERGLDQSATHDGLSNCNAIADARQALAAYEAAQ